MLVGNGMGLTMKAMEGVNRTPNKIGVSMAARMWSFDLCWCNVLCYVGVVQDNTLNAALNKDIRLFFFNFMKYAINYCSGKKDTKYLVRERLVFFQI